MKRSRNKAMNLKIKFIAWKSLMVPCQVGRRIIAGINML